ncbi:MAG TPA: hypothetical protein VH165_24530, partial [Kofleriaceae bacterium]|nr:hypothetical protein [Kofleriaceae bacterium]
MSFARQIATWLGRWPPALLACALLAGALILPQLGGPGLWEPQERQLSDRIAPPIVSPAPTAAPAPPPAVPGAKDGCQRATPSNASARTLTARAVVWGRDTFGDSDAGRRWPIALLGLFTVLAAAGTAIRLAGPRAGVVTAIVLLAMPLATLQSRMLTSEIGTPCGAALIIYGLVALGSCRRGRGVARTAADLAVGAAALAAGLAAGFYGGGVLLGLIVPIGAVAVAGGLGAPLVTAIRTRAPIGPAATALVAALATVALVALLAHQLYDLKPLYPGLTPPPAREVLGRAIIPTNCYSWALGGMWRPDDDLRIIYDSSFEQIAYGTFPWGLLAPVAMAMLIAAPDPRRRRLGALTLAWAGAAWVAGEVFQRKVGFTVYAGFPALAIAVGAWLDDLWTRRAHGEPGAIPPGAKLIALFAVLGVLDLGKDIQSFAEKLTSLFVGADAVPYPTQSHFLWLPTRLWVLILGMIIAAAFATAISVARREG